MKTELEKCLAGESFNGSDKELTDMTLRAKRLLKKFNDTDYGNTEERNSILRKLFGKMGDNVWVDIDLHCEYGSHIFIGNNVVINMNCTLVDNNFINIGNDVLIASNVQIYTATHSTNVNERMIRKEDGVGGICYTIARPITICDGAWIGGGSIILPGVTIGKNSVIGAGSIVTRSIPDNCVAVGNPCRVIKRVEL